MCVYVCACMCVCVCRCDLLANNLLVTYFEQVVRAHLFALS